MHTWTPSYHPNSCTTFHTIYGFYRIWHGFVTVSLKFAPLPSASCTGTSTTTCTTTRSAVRLGFYYSSPEGWVPQHASSVAIVPMLVQHATWTNGVLYYNILQSTSHTHLFDMAPVTYFQWLGKPKVVAVPQGDGEEPALPSMEERRSLGWSFQCDSRILNGKTRSTKGFWWRLFEFGVCRETEEPLKMKATLVEISLYFGWLEILAAMTMFYHLRARNLGRGK